MLSYATYCLFFRQSYGAKSWSVLGWRWTMKPRGWTCALKPLVSDLRCSQPVSPTSKAADNPGFSHVLDNLWDENKNRTWQIANQHHDVFGGPKHHRHFDACENDALLSELRPKRPIPGSPASITAPVPNAIASARASRASSSANPTRARLRPTGALKCPLSQNAARERSTKCLSPI